jgi:hypothetical protein
MIRTNRSEKIGKKSLICASQWLRIMGSSNTRKTLFIHHNSNALCSIYTNGWKGESSNP